MARNLYVLWTLWRLQLKEKLLPVQQGAVKIQHALQLEGKGGILSIFFLTLNKLNWQLDDVTREKKRL